VAKTWQQKYDERAEPEVKPLAKAMLGHEAGDVMLISTPAEIEVAVRAIPAGRSVSLAELRAGLAGRHSADFTCPLTTGIFLRIAAECSLARDDEPMPFWRVIDAHAPLAAKLSCGPAYIAARRQAEGLPG
jgi:hypothetical protein